MRDSQDILEPKFAKLGLDVRPVDLGRWTLSAVPGILREVAGHRPDVILMQYPTGAFGSSLGPVAIAAVQRIAPLVVMLHEFVAAHPLRKLAVGALLARVRLVGLTAQREADVLGRVYPWLRSRLRHIPIASNLPPRPWSPAEPAQVVYFGQLRPEKGLETFFECHDLIVAAMPHVKFRIIGATVPKFAEYASRIRELAHSRSISILNGPEADEAADALARATVALLPFPDGASFRRGSLFAAAGCGVPLVTNLGKDTPPELLPFLEPARDAAELSGLAIRYLSDGPSRARANARSVELSGLFGWDLAAARYLEVFREAAGDQRIVATSAESFAYSHSGQLGRPRSTIGPEISRQPGTEAGH